MLKLLTLFALLMTNSVFAANEKIALSLDPQCPANNNKEALVTETILPDYMQPLGEIMAKLYPENSRSRGLEGSVRGLWTTCEIYHYYCYYHGLGYYCALCENSCLECQQRRKLELAAAAERDLAVEDPNLWGDCPSEFDDVTNEARDAVSQVLKNKSYFVDANGKEQHCLRCKFYSE